LLDFSVVNRFFSSSGGNEVKIRSELERKKIAYILEKFLHKYQS